MSIAASFAHPGIPQLQNRNMTREVEYEDAAGDEKVDYGFEG
jgi:hypothetical protein